ncbi:MAG: hypothetical protein FGM58_09180 [Acidimicrobiia bacterium]|nr:hypothetical protein [Acidimicrobiia bacterium]
MGADADIGRSLPVDVDDDPTRDQHRRSPLAPSTSVLGVAATVEFTVEPFTEGEPGDHVVAALAAVRAEGYTVEVGPFGSSFTCPADRAAAVVERLTASAVEAGATRVSVQVTVDPS